MVLEKYMEKRYRWKIITIIVLCILILLGLLYLHFFLKKGEGGLFPKPTPTPTPTAEPTPTPIPTPTPTPEPTPIPVDLDSDDSIQRVLNQTHPVDRTYVPSDLREVNVYNGEAGVQYLRSEAADQLERLFQDAINQEIYFKLISGYRDYDEQSSLYNTYVAMYGEARANVMDDHPGASEHQLGLAVDLGNWNGQCELNACFVDYPSYAFLKEHGHEYGFIERYPFDKQNITGIEYSPWHWRYVGVEEATKIKESGLTVEEYYGY